MSFRGRGRGRGRGGFGGGFRPGKQVSWEPFPEIENLGTAAGLVERFTLARYYSRLQSYWKASPYYLEGPNESTKKAKGWEIESYRDKIAEKTKSKAPLSHFIKMEPGYVPAELARGDKKEKHPSKRVRWVPESDLKDLQKLDLFEKLEQKYQGQDASEKKEDEDEEEDDERVEDEEEEYSTDGDYEQAEDFDDDEDDYNMADDNNDEPEY